MDDNLKAQVLAAFTHGGQREEDLSEDDPRRQAGRRIGVAFTEAVAFLRTSFPNPAIRALMAMVWEIVGSKIVPFALGPAVETLSMASANRAGLPSTIILAPHNWMEQIQQDAVLQMGAVVFVGAQAVDSYNGKLQSRASFEDCIKRARAYEAEFLLTLSAHGLTTSFNDYQKKVLEDFPKGLRTDTIVPLLYTPKPFVPPA